MENELVGMMHNLDEQEKAALLEELRREVGDERLEQMAEFGRKWRAFRETDGFQTLRDFLQAISEEVSSRDDLKDIKGAEALTALGELLQDADFQHRIEERLERMGDDAEPVEVIANYPITKAYVDHSLAMKTLDNGLFAIAMGEPYFELTPKGGKSKEAYRLTASADACSRFFAESKGNAEHIKDVLETVYTLRTDKRAEGFIYRGRIWFTVNTIVQEMRRTKGGTVRAKEYQRDRKLVDNALLAASGAQIVGTRPNGEPTNTFYLINATRRKKITLKQGSREITYTDVWGFDASSDTVTDYARELGNAYRYPLLELDKPLTLDEAWIERYLKDALNEARDGLYSTRKGKPYPRKATSYTVTRSWPEIFDKAQPIGSMGSRQKAKLVDTFDKMLSVLADMDAHDKLRAGYPLYIKAYSERDAARGRGRGEWKTLVIECSRHTHAPVVKLESGREEVEAELSRSK